MVLQAAPSFLTRRREVIKGASLKAPLRVFVSFVSSREIIYGCLMVRPFSKVTALV